LHQYSRGKFIKLAAAAGAAVWLDACGLGRGKKAAQTATAVDTLPEVPATLVPEPPAPMLPTMVSSGDPRYDILRLGYNRRIDYHPETIALCRTTEDVSEAVRYARSRKLPIAVKSGGHSMEGYSCNDGGMVINMGHMNEVTLSADGMLTAGPGCTLSRLYDHLLPQGRLLPAGSCGSVSLGGLTLGGGYGLFARKYGLTCDHLIAATMVDGNGNVHKAMGDDELMWALRGGGTGNFGIVTEMQFSTQRAPATLKAMHLKVSRLTATRAASVLKVWMEVAAAMPESCFSGYVLNGGTLNILITDFEHDRHNIIPVLQPLIDVAGPVTIRNPRPLYKMLPNYYGRANPLYFRNSSAGFFNGYDDVAPFIEDVFDKIITTPGMIYQVNTLGELLPIRRKNCYPAMHTEHILLYRRCRLIPRALKVKYERQQLHLIY